MEAYVNLSSAQNFELKNAILIYKTDSHRNAGGPGPSSFVTSHEVKLSDQGAPSLNPGRPVTMDEIVDMIEEVRGSLPIEFLPDNVLVRTQESTVWWVPATVRPMFYAHKGSPELAELSGKNYPQPPLVFRATARSLDIMALAKNERPTLKSQLFLAPYWNLYGNGNVCLGSTALPKDVSIASLPLWEKAFYQSKFTHANVQTKLTKHEGGFVGLWKSLAGKKKFPTETLVPMKKTLADFIGSK
jgi:PRTRC genetic system protein B